MTKKDNKNVGYRINSEDLTRIEKVKPLTKSVSQFMRDMAFIGLDYTVSKAGSQDEIDSKVLKEIKKFSTIVETAINDLRNSIKDVSERQDSMVNVISSNIENIIQGGLTNTINNKSKDMFQSPNVKKLTEDIEGLKSMLLRLANDDRLKGLNANEIDLLRNK